MGFVRLSAVVLFLPLVSLASIPLVVTAGMAAVAYRVASALVWAVLRRLLPRSIVKRILWQGAGGDDDEEVFD